MKALEILKLMSKGILDFDYKEDCNEAIKELELIDNNLKNLFSSIELTENETAEKRLSSMQTYLDRLKRDLR